MTRTEVKQLLGILRMVWPDATVTDDTITAWSWAFEDIPARFAEDAAKRWMKTGKFFPKPAEILELIGAQVVAPGLVPEAAWSEVQREVKRVGFQRYPVFRNGAFEPLPTLAFSSALIAEAVDAVGWETICTSDKPEVVRAQFVKALDAIARRSIRQVQTGDVPVDGEAIEAGEDRVIALGQNGVRS